MSNFEKFSVDFDALVNKVAVLHVAGRGEEAVRMVLTNPLSRDPMFTAHLADVAFRKAQAYECLQGLKG